MVMLTVVAAGVVFAFWLPTRNDSASANENGYGSSWGQNRDWRHFWSGRGQHAPRNPSWPGFPSGSASPSASPSESASADPSDDPTATPSDDPTSEPPSSESPSAEPTSEPPSTAPTSEAPTTAPTTTPPTTAPAKAKWAPFTDYSTGQIVTYKGKDYEVLADHTSLPGWEPPTLTALFKLVS